MPREERKLRVHAEVGRLIKLGASQLRIMDNSSNHYAVAKADAEGNEFDLV